MRKMLGRIFVSARSPRLGPELVTGTDSDMSGPNNWAAGGTGLGALDVNSTVAGKLYMLGDGGQDFTSLIPVFLSGGMYEITLKARLHTGASTTIRVGENIGAAGKYFDITPTGTEGTYTGVVNLTIGGGLAIGSLDGFSGIAFEIDDVSVREILR